MIPPDRSNASHDSLREKALLKAEGIIEEVLYHETYKNPLLEARDYVADALESFARETQNATHCKIRCGCFAYEQARKESVVEWDFLASTDLKKRIRKEALEECIGILTYIDDSGECLPKCDSYGHEELCAFANPMFASMTKIRSLISKDAGGKKS